MNPHHPDPLGHIAILVSLDPDTTDARTALRLSLDLMQAAATQDDERIERLRDAAHPGDLSWCAAMLANALVMTMKDQYGADEARARIADYQRQLPA